MGGTSHLAGAPGNAPFQVGQQYRSSDDGEPGGTAGRPILAAIEGEGLDGVCVLVIRWVGGRWGMGARRLQSWTVKSALQWRSLPSVCVSWVLQPSEKILKKAEAL